MPVTTPSDQTVRWAMQQALLAAERTILAYVRTVLALFVAGLSILRFFEEDAYLWIGWLLILSAAILAGITAWRYYQVRRRIYKAGEPQ